MEKMKYYTVVLDGIDKCGKDTIASYIWRLDKRLNIAVRAWPSLYVYAKKFKRNVKYELPYRNALYVYLTVDKEDWNIRCNITNEPKIDYDNDTKLFDKAFNILDNNGYNIIQANTSELTAYEIAKGIVDAIYKLNMEDDYE